ncbi:STING ER exit protein [Polyrhizophydium stewartii]|uniref:STING ER exit protein n=1 Tax=Polyrhizophydium stewartii TaxID=2732419 RepID=A0ABR4NJD5_9FUNG|nr:UPF0428 protein CXorf56 [Polyrhizophydium stewartii]
MPKVVSRGIVSEYDPDNDRNGLNVYYCAVCSEYLLALDTELEKLPRRRTDGAFIVNKERRTATFKTEEGKTLLIQRAAGFERQQRQHCPGCQLLVAYAESADAPFTYVVDGALSLAPK